MLAPTSNTAIKRSRVRAYPSQTLLAFQAEARLALRKHKNIESLKAALSKPNEILIRLKSDHWLTRAGKVLKNDVDNRIKYAIDSLYRAVDLKCDEYVFRITAEKVHSDREETVFYVTELETIDSMESGVEPPVHGP